MTLRASASGMSSSTVSKVSTGLATPAANGAANVFSFAHGLSATPSFVAVTSKTVLGAIDFATSWDGTNITVTYVVAPSPGTLSFSWVAFS